jgi:uroporphyrinogen decarboxylase
MATAGPSVVGVDWRTPLDAARARIEAAVDDRAVAVQGNLDPAACLAPWPVVEAKVREVLDANGGRPGHVFNLGHGVLPETDPAILTQVVALVHEATAA